MLEIVHKLNLNPEIRVLLREFQDLLVAKGFNPEEPPNFMKLMGLFAQKDVRELAGRLKAKLEETGIEISPSDVNLLMGMMKK